MYWLVGSLIVLVMMAVLSVADSMTVSVNPFLVDIASTSTLFTLLVMLVIILMVFAQSNIPLVNFKNPASNFSRHLSSESKPSLRVTTYILVPIIATGIIFGSALQAIVSHQQADSAEIANSNACESFGHS